MLHSDINSQGGLIWSKNLPKHSLKSYFRWDFLFAWRVWPYIFTIWMAMAHTASTPMLHIFNIARFIGIQSIWAQICSSLVLIDPNWSPKRWKFPLALATPGCLPGCLGATQHGCGIFHETRGPGAHRVAWHHVEQRIGLLGIVAMKPQNLLFNKFKS